jgi:hypothetical protein
MRTTLNIAEEVWLAAKGIGRFEQKSAGQVISELVRKGLQPAGTLPSYGQEEFLGFRPLPPRGVIVRSELIERLIESSE